MWRRTTDRLRHGALGVIIVWVGGLWGCRPLGETTPAGASKRVSAYLQVSQEDPKLLSADRTVGMAAADKEFSIFKLTVAALAKNPFVLNAALNQPGIKSLSIVADRADPAGWLQNEIHVEPSESEILELWMRPQAGAATETARLLTAVAESLVEELDGKAKRERTKRLSDLEQARVTLERNLRKNAATIQSLREDLGNSSPEQAEQRHQFLMMVLRETYANERTFRAEILKRQVALSQLRAQLEAANETTAVDVRRQAERDPLLLELTRQWGEAQRRLMEADIVGDEQDKAKVSALVERLTAAMDQRLSVARDAAQAAVDEANEKQQRHLSSQLIGNEVALAMYEQQLKVLSDQKSELEADVAKMGKVSGELERFQAEHLTLQEHFKKIDSEMLLLQSQLNAPARVKLVQSATGPEQAHFSKPGSM